LAKDNLNTVSKPPQERSTSEPVIELLKLPPIQWRRAVQEMTSKERRNMRDNLELLCVRAGALSSYLDECIFPHTLDDDMHFRGGNMFRSRARKLRTAIGFSYPQEGDGSIEF
jgi:hypothetical protein